MNSTDFQSALEQLRQEYFRNLPGKVSEITLAWQALRENVWNPEQFQTCTRLAHSLAGSGATYGFTTVSQAARALEHFLKSLPDDSPPPDDAQQEIENLIERLRLAVGSETASNVPAHKEPSISRADRASESQSKQLWLYEPDAAVAQELEAQLEFFNYAVTRCELAAFSQLESLPSAVIVDWDAAQLDDDAALDAVGELHRAEPVLPIVFLSEKDTLPARLEAVRHGATAYLIKPFVPDHLLEILDTQMGHRSAEPFRILIVDDDESLATRSSFILQQAGMLTHVITDPLHVMRPLVEFRPDLILSDMHMPNLSGLELAAVLRQQDAYVNIPIVFLSSETDLNTQLSAMLTGGDDFLLKPIEAHHLVGKVTSRVQRARTLRGFAERDSLTGLLNHTRFKERLNIEVSRAIRAQSQLSFAMLDIDYFKSVNDSYGHPTGDRILKSLARLLIQRLRKSDILGRYGGEEFAVILPETDGSAAYEVIEEMRAAFAEQKQFSGGEEFFVTFSAGIATLPPYAEVETLTEAADRALYQAKRDGRNMVVLAWE